MLLVSIAHPAGHTELVLDRKGHMRRFALRELAMVCPAYQLFGRASNA
jgi:hypothetical protein